MNTTKLLWPHRLRASSHLALLAGALLCIPASVAAQVEAPTAETAKETFFWKRETVTGDWGGARSVLNDKFGTEVTLNYIGGVFSVLSGGLHRHTNYQGRLE